jgi:rSAM/selenodomain-associated transferase 1
MADTLIQLFARPPVAGRVKTRLIPAIGHQAALEVYRYCLQHNQSLIGNTGFDYQLWLSDEDENNEFANEPAHLQRGLNLGQRMLHALQQGLNSHRHVILIGSDCLDMDVPLLKQVDTRLDTHALVLVPALDGGYVLIACSDSIHPALFRDIPWGSDQVLATTQLRIAECNIEVYLFEPLRDIDRVEDVQQYPALRKYL